MHPHADERKSYGSIVVHLSASPQCVNLALPFVSERASNADPVRSAIAHDTPRADRRMLSSVLMSSAVAGVFGD
jgi:hypothetical protein